MDADRLDPPNQKNGWRFQYISHARCRCFMLAERRKEAGLGRRSPVVDVVRVQRGSSELLM